MSILLIDFETTGLDPSKDRIVEVGAKVVDEGWSEIDHLSAICYDKSYPNISPDITRLTGITQELVDERGVFIDAVVDVLHEMCGDHGVTHSIAFNSVFDQGFYNAECERQKRMVLTAKWLCAMTDIESNYQFKSWKLMHLALEYGVTVNPKELHRAINDVELMRQTILASGATIQSMENFRNIPWIVIRALIPAPWEDGGKGKTLAQGLGYSWETPKGSDVKIEKAWVKRIKAHQLDNEVKQAPFKVRQV